MNLYSLYMQLWKEGLVNAGFSPRLPDYAIKYWLENLEQALARFKPKNFLDIGAGDGRLSLLLLRAGYTRGVGVEVQVNKAVWHPILSRYNNFELYDGFLQDYVTGQINKQQFDFVLMSEVFEHIPPADIGSFLLALHRVVSDGGKIFLTTPNVHVQGLAENSPVWYQKQPYGHYKHYALDELKDLLNKAGFKVVWYAFECHRIKSVLYNKWFYPLSRFDGKCLNSKKVPSVIKTIYRIVTAPLLFVIKGFLWLLGQLVYFIEKRYSKENTAGTMMLLIEKR